MININSDRVRAFFQLSIDKSFSKASKSLGISQSGLSQKIALLENELQTTLVIRTTKSLKITESGKRLIQYFNVKKDLDKELFTDLTGGTDRIRGEIRVAGYSSVVRSAIIPALSPVIAKENLKFNIRSMEVYDLEPALLAGEVDFIVSTAKVKKSNIIQKEIGKEENIHIIPTSGEQNLPFLDHDEFDTTTFDFFRKQKKEIDYRRCYLDDVYNIIQGVESGIGQAIVSKHLVSQNPQVLKKKYKIKMRSIIYLSYFQRPYYTSLQKEIISILEDNFKNYL